MARRFPRSELVFDTISEKGVFYADKMLDTSDMTNAVMQWGIDDPMIIEGWSSHIKVSNKIPFFKEIKTMKQIPFMLRLKMFFYDLVNKSCIVRLKFC